MGKGQGPNLKTWKMLDKLCGVWYNVHCVNRVFI